MFMSICDECGKAFDEDDASLRFFEECIYDYEMEVVGKYCFDCLKEKVENEEPGVISCTCDWCSKAFDPFQENLYFQADISRYHIHDADIEDEWDPNQRLCAECTMKKLEESWRFEDCFNDYPEFSDYPDD